MAGVFTWLTVSDAISELGQRLYITPSTTSFWTSDELFSYLVRSLQMYNVLTNFWKVEFSYNSTSLWNSLGALTDSPRLRTITDQQAYADLEYMLLEPSNLTSTWTGTIQFSISDLSQALQRRRDEMIQVSNCNQSLSTFIPLTPNTITTQLPSSNIDVARVRYLPLQFSTSGAASSGASTITVSSTTGIANGQLVTGTGIAYPTTVSGVGSGSIQISQPTTGVVSGTLQFFTANTLYRDDTIAQEFYEAPLYQQPSGTPQTFSLSSEPPLSWIVDIPPTQPGNYEAVVLNSGAPFTPPTPTLLGIPDDLVFVLEYGALADLLSREPEATDRERAEYCMRRYQDGLQLMLKTPWIMLGKVNGVAVSCDSLRDMDNYSVNWDSDPSGFGPVIVTGGIDFLAAPTNSNVGVTVLGNAPITDPSGTYLQIAPSDADTMYNLAQTRALFKRGGSSFKEALALEAEAIQFCSAKNTMLRSTGAFSDILMQRGQAQERAQNRYNTKPK
jgi:hypothetical protein